MGADGARPAFSEPKGPGLATLPHNFSKGCQTIQLLQPTAPPATHRALLVVSPGEQKESNINSVWDWSRSQGRVEAVSNT